ncbi:MAG: Short-chain-enoyl-CoA hydratase [Acidimicrobiales bacterium]|nr:MAG: enoyl-CoA hydratase/isomerase family protein [Actinomycetota bacterium]MBV6507483.1 Short-chain-enoyl-CoA hydratase [Acidimicrobiales bacterium]RIK07860.1 MAG: enoyl-CoA hydratase [Acidobacteriota bacterium]
MGDERPLEDRLIHRNEEGVVRITLNAPDAGNALSADMRDRLTEVFEEASGDMAVRSVLLRAAGERHFCTGAALGGQRPSVERPDGAPDPAVGDAARTIRNGWQRLIAAILDCEKPVVAAVNGTAAGGGAHLALACDLILMADSAKFVEVFVRRGIIPDAGGAYLLPRLVGLHRAKELMFLGDEVSAAHADRIGLVNRVVPLAELERESDALATRLAEGPTRAIALTKWLLNRSLDSSRQTCFEDEAVAQELASATEDCREGVASFIERRDPDFKGW